MAFNRLKARVTNIRQQPEHIRHRKAALYTIVAGVGISIIWVTLLLPLQLNLRDRGQEDATASSRQATEQPALPAPAVGGIQDTSGEFQRLIDESATTPTLLPTPTPTPTPTAEQILDLPVSIGAGEPTPTPEGEVVPVEITE